jgi:diadenosine tetraphosphate (Ap4A) HIT family hydrolase
LQAGISAALPAGAAFLRNRYIALTKLKVGIPWALHQKRTSGGTMAERDFCAEFRTGEENLYSELLMEVGKLPRDHPRIVAQSGDLVVFPSLGELEDGHLLISPRYHVTSMLHLTAADREELVKEMHRIRETYRGAHGHYPIFFEHGNPTRQQEGFANCIEHAHLHALPSNSATVELTARGAYAYQLLEHAIPIVDTGRSELKKSIESPLIAESMVRRLLQEIEDLEPDLTCFAPCVVGKGAIGGAIVDYLKSIGMNVRYFDLDEDRSSGFTLEALSKRSSAILSSTGKGINWLHCLKSAGRSLVFVNCGSSDVEFQLWQLNRLSYDEPLITKVANPESPWRGPVHVTFKDKTAVFLNGGFPINFDGSEDPIPARKIQLTRAALMAGAIQASRATSRGVMALDTKWQEQIAATFKQYG